MKHLVPISLFSLFIACTPSREIEADMVDARLVKVSIVNRYPDIQKKELKWETPGLGVFITYEPVSANVLLGTVAKVMIKK